MPNQSKYITLIMGLDTFCHFFYEQLEMRFQLLCLSIFKKLLEFS